MEQDKIKQIQEDFAIYKSLGAEIVDLLNLKPDRLGFYQTKLGMKTKQGIGEAIVDSIEKIIKERVDKTE